MTATGTNPRGLMIDDHLLRDVICGDMPRCFAQAVQEAEVLMTTDLMVVRLAGALIKSGSGKLGGPLSAAQQATALASLVTLPPSIRVWPLGEWPVEVARLMAVYAVATWCASGLVGAAAHNLCFAVDARNLGLNVVEAATDLGVSVMTVDHASGECTIRC